MLQQAGIDAKAGQADLDAKSAASTPVALTTAGGAKAEAKAEAKVEGAAGKSDFDEILRQALDAQVCWVGQLLGAASRGVVL
jgi:hypothetical protein